MPSPLRGEGAQRADEGPQKEMISDKILRWAQGSVLRAQQLMEIKWKYDSTLTFDEAYELGQEVVEEEKLLPFLESLLCETHQRLTEQKEDSDLNFDLLVFADRILEIRRSLRQNANPKIHLTRLLMFFQEPTESRL